MNIPSLKKHMIKEFLEMPLYDELSDYRLILITSAGIIIGDPVTEDDSDDVANDLSKTVKIFTDDYYGRNNIDKNVSLDNDDGFLCLKNVELKSSTNTFHIPFITIFYNDIIGITIGKM